MGWWKRLMGGSSANRDDDSDAAESAEARPSGALPRGVTILLGLAAAVVVAFGLWGIRSFMAPVLLALILTICVHPLRRRLERWGFKQGLATGFVITAVFVLLAAFVTALVVALAQFAALLPQFGPQLQAIGNTIANALASVGFGQDQVHAIVEGFDPSRILAFVSGLLGSVANLTFALVIILTTLILMAVDASSLSVVLHHLRTARPHMVDAVSGFAVGVRRYMLATTALGIVQGVLNWFALWLLGVPGAFLWGLLSFLCSYIPNIGYFIAIVPPLVFALLSGGWPIAVAVLVIYAAINAVVQSIIQPRVVGHAVALSQTITFVSVLFWAVVIGPIGAILAIPLTLLVRTILIDSDPAARWWRPLIGDLAQASDTISSEDDDADDSRRAPGSDRHHE